MLVITGAVMKKFPLIIPGHRGRITSVQSKSNRQRGDLMQLWAKRTLLILFLSLILLLGAGPAAAKPPVVSAHSALLMDAFTGQVYYDKKGLARSEPASLTKIMTVILALECGRLDEVATVGKRAAAIHIGQQLDLAQGDRITLENLVKGALLHSANDSTVAIAQHIAGSEERFIGLMNTKALVLGALNTKYANTNGYHHPNHYTTAYDLALITRYALNNSTFARLVSTPRDTILWADGKKQKEVNNTNRLIRDNSYEGIIGVKTGSTSKAGNCLIAAARRGDRILIAVVLHSRNRYKDAVKLLDYGFSEVSPLTLCAKSQDFGRVPVAGGLTDSVMAVAGRTAEVELASDDQDKVTQKTVLFENLQAPVQAGQKVGEVTFTLRHQELARVDLLAAEEVLTPGLIHRIKKSLSREN